MRILEADLELMEVQVPEILMQMEWQSLQTRHQDLDCSWVVTWTVAGKTECWLEVGLLVIEAGEG